MNVKHLVLNNNEIVVCLDKLEAAFKAKQSLDYGIMLKFDASPSVFMVNYKEGELRRDSDFEILTNTLVANILNQNN